MEMSRDRPLSTEEQKMYLKRCNEVLKKELEEYKIETFDIPRLECFQIFDLIDRGRKTGNELELMKEEMMKSVETESNVIRNDSNIIPNVLWDNVTLHQVNFHILLGTQFRFRWLNIKEIDVASAILIKPISNHLK